MEEETEKLNRDSWLFYKGSPIDIPLPEGVTGPIYAIGDSHIHILMLTLPDIFKKNTYLSISAHAISNEPKEYEYISNALHKIPEGSKLISCFGEIDCRHYIPDKSREKNITIEEEVTSIIDRYTKNFLTFLQTKYRMIVISPYVGPHDLVHPNNSYEDIVEAKTIYSDQLRKFCETAGIAYVPTYEEGFKNEWHRFPLATYFNDTTHLGPCMIPVIFESIKDFKWKGFDDAK